MMFRILFKFEIATSISRFLNLDDLNKEDAFFCKDHIFIGILDILRLYDFYDVTHLCFNVFDIFTKRFRILPFLFLNVLFKIEISNNQVARWLEDLDVSVFTSKDYIVFRICMEFCKLHAWNLKRHV
jgi:hypothetical protein